MYRHHHPSPHKLVLRIFVIKRRPCWGSEKRGWEDRRKGRDREETWREEGEDRRVVGMKMGEGRGKIWLKGQCHEIFDSNFCCLKQFTLATCEQTKTELWTYWFSQRYSITKFEIRVSAKSTPTQTYVFCEYIPKNEKFRYTFFACLNGAHV